MVVLAAKSSLSSSGSNMAYATLPASEPLDNRPLFWDSTVAAGAANYLSKVLAEPVPFVGTSQFAKLGKGFIISPPLQQSGKPVVAQCFFRYNPNQYDYSYEFDMSAIGATPPTFSNGTQIRGLALNATLSIELFFERIQDLWIANNEFGGKYGVLWDIWAVERLCGVYGQSTGQNPSGPPVTQPMTLWMGGKGNNTAFHMSGLITGLDVEVTQFDSNMVPSVATVSLQFVRVLNPNANLTNTGNPITGNSSVATAALKAAAIAG